MIQLILIVIWVLAPITLVVMGIAYFMKEAKALDAEIARIDEEIDDECSCRGAQVKR